MLRLRLPDGSAFDALLFLSFGGPEKVEDVRPFLENVTRGRGVPPDRFEDVVQHYSALNEERLHADGERILRRLDLTLQQAADLAAFLRSLSR